MKCLIENYHLKEDDMNKTMNNIMRCKLNDDINVDDDYEMIVQLLDFQ